MKNWHLDPNTGDYVMENGSPKQTESLQVPAYVRLKVRRNQWLYAPDNDYGSDYYLLKRKQGNLDASTVEAVGARALQPLISDGRANQITVDTLDTARGGIQMKTQIIDAAGEPEEIIFSRLGV